MGVREAIRRENNQKIENHPVVSPWEFPIKFRAVYHALIPYVSGS